MPFKEGEKLIIVHYGELWLRGKNRGYYINVMKKNLKDQLKGEKYSLKQEYDRLIMTLSKDSDIESIRDKLSHVFGISNFEISYTTKPNLSSINKLSKKLLAKMKDKKIIKVDAHRSWKGSKFNSMDIIDKVRTTARRMGFEVTNHGYDAVVKVNLTKDAAFVTADKVRAQRGLPVGTSGVGIVLLSGGIDSPVAAWYAMKRGIFPIYLHVHGLPDNKDVMDSKMAEILKILKKYSMHAKIYTVPAHLFQIKAGKSGKYELVLLKAFMMRLAEKVAEKEQARVIFTGESLGQVASQTLSNMTAEAYGVNTPILRPLVGFDKEEIIKVAKEIGTYDESVKPYRDVCSINSRNPATQIDIDRMKELIKEFDVDKLVKKSLSSGSVFEV
jgi:tRNA uracil 4-sulfurtransferase